MRKRRCSGRPNGTSGVRMATPSSVAAAASRGPPSSRRRAVRPSRRCRPSRHPPRPTIRWQSMQWAAHGQRLEPLGGDRAAAADAGPERPLVEPPRARPRPGRGAPGCGRAGQGRVAARRPGSPPRPASRRSSRPGATIPVATSARRRSRSATRVARGSGACGCVIARSYAGRGRCSSASRRVAAILPRSTQKEHIDMAIAIDPVCGMEVETDLDRPEARARGHDLLVLRQGLPARVPRRPGHVPRPELQAVDVGRRPCAVGSW